ncbi:hypothetical protein [Actinoplanes subglobosus]|uniref:Uncharacterized protein n=1 Tax=Actinoplanes subglobosus TaxID=1547892 RepID=A0ABV8IQY7_9ACTN
MSGLVTPEDAVAAVAGKLGQRCAQAVCAESGAGDCVVFSVRLRPRVRTGKAGAGTTPGRALRSHS